MKGIGAGELHHVAVAVPSLAETVPFYRDVLGYRVDEPRLIAEQRVRVVFATREGSRGVEGLVAFLHPRAANGVLVELIDRASLATTPKSRG
jgi:catechol 2,3-dioxygenase-like lactoylglutathione lyase family enzyme